jgi:hypothetical protein
MTPVRLVALVLVLVAAWAPPAAAEWFADFYLGMASTRTSDVETTFPSGITTSQEVDWSTNVTLGARAGHWLERPDWLPWLPAPLDVGAALDVSLFAPAGNATVVPIAALLMVRMPLLRDDEFPEGRLQPYGAAGPALFLSTVDGLIGNQRDVSDTSVDVGVDIRAGAAFRVTPLIALFAEYRFTHVQPEFSRESGTGTVTSTTTFDTHHVLTGLGLRF